MAQNDCVLFLIGRKSRPVRRRARRTATPALGDALERRDLLAVSGLTAAASPSILTQINPMDQPHAVQVAVIRPVTLAGYVLDNANMVPRVSFRVVDQFGKDEPRGTIKTQQVQPGQFFFTARFGLNRSPMPGTHTGRQYTIFVNASDQQNFQIITIPLPTKPSGK